MYDDWMERILIYFPSNILIKVNILVTFNRLGKAPYSNIHSIRSCPRPSLTLQ